ncbi:MAG TPA: LysR substrate-binding domain-containing protein [Solidesulfovibrio magneticus]|nr:LysR substrate-binding domain-containing protein [Solidesulfovibrio magneticus]
MELRDFRYVLAVAEELHFGRAAARLHMSQPPLSQRIRDIENDLGTPLFTRTSRRVALTPAGQALADKARHILALADEAAALAQRVGEGLAGRLTLGFVNPAMDAFLAAALPRFRHQAPDVELRLQEMTTPQQTDALAAGRLDLGFIRYAGQTIPGIAITEILREPYVLALPANHPLTNNPTPSLADLHNQPLVIPPPAALPALAQAMAAAFAKAGASPIPVQEASSKFTTLGLVAAGLGLALVPASAQVWQRQNVAFRPLAHGLPPVIHAAAIPEGRATAMAERMMDLAREEGKRLEINDKWKNASGGQRG